MSRGPGIHEIFSKQAMWKNNTFQFVKQEYKQQIQLSKKKVMAPLPPLNKFTDYKSKILSDETSLHDSTTEEDGTAVSKMPQLKVKSKLAPLPASLPLATIKPWIIGDKNIPLVLEYVTNANEKVFANNTTDHGLEQSHIYETVDDSDQEYMQFPNDHQKSPPFSTLNYKDVANFTEEIYNNKFQNDLKYSEPFGATSLSKDATVGYMTSDRELIQEIDEPKGVMIPAPDYDEEEQTLDFNAEDIADDVSDEKPKQTKLNADMKLYEGADLSHYLKDDEDETETVRRYESKTRNTLRRKDKPVIMRPKHGDKYFLFKQKNKGKVVVPPFNSVRNFSYADSKLAATRNAENKSFSLSNITDEGDIFLSANSRRSSYELFLRSRHGETLHQEYTDIGVDVREDGLASLFPNKKHTMLKKFALRLRHSIDKSLRFKVH